MKDLDGIIFTILMSAYVLFIILLRRYKVTFMHESSIAIIVGISFAVHMKQIHGKYLNIDPTILFDFVQPPIIMYAAKNQKYDLFFNNFHYIFWFGCVGTFITFFGFFCFIDLFASLGAFPDLAETEGLQLAAALTATDTVGVQTLIKEKDFPNLYSIIFGEGIINDAVAILLFQAISNMMKDGNESTLSNFSLFSLNGMSILFKEFFYSATISFVIGIGLGFLLSYQFKRQKISREESALEITLLFLFAYFAYLLPEAFDASGIMALFTYIVVIQNYGSKSMSNRAQKVFLL